MATLKDSSMLVSLHMSTWTGRKFDKQATKEVDDLHGSKNAGRFNKILVAEEAIKAVNQIVSSARDYHYKQTLAWDDYGRRLLPSTNYFEYMDGISNFKAQFDQAVGDFIAKYDVLREEAKKRLNGLFKEADYPSVVDLRRKYGFVHKISTIEDTDDFRVAMDEAEQLRIKESIELNLKTSLHNATSDIWDRVKDKLGYMIERLKEPDAVFRESLIGNIRDLVNLLPRLNFADDPKVIAVCHDLRTLLVDTDLLRRDASARESTMLNAKNIMQSYGL